jgi:VanZ family protein
LGISIPSWRKPLLLHYWVPPILWTLAVIGMSGDLGSSSNTGHLLQWLLSWVVALKPAQINEINFYLRKTGHVLAYGGMYFLWFRAFRGHADYGPGVAFLWSLGLCLLFSSTDEGHQWFCSSRGGCLRDVLLDLSGASLAALITFAVWTPNSKAPAISWTAGGQTTGPE